MLRDHEPLAHLKELRLPKAERGAARAERRVEAQIRRERDNTETAERRHAAMLAESQRYRGYGPY